MMGRKSKKKRGRGGIWGRDALAGIDAALNEDKHKGNWKTELSYSYLKACRSRARGDIEIGQDYLRQV